MKALSETRFTKIAQSFVRRLRGFIALPVAVVLVITALLFAGCDDESTILAPYLGSRPLTILRVTQSSQPDIQWVGGRVAAVGVNRGAKPALDETLIWLATAADNTLDSPLRVGENTDAARIISFGGTPVDSLPSGDELTFWVAELDAFEGDLIGATTDSFLVRDTTVTLNYFLRGRSGGDRNLGVEYQITRNQSIVDDRYTITWTPTTQAFRRIAIRQASLGGFTDLVWHVVLPDEAPDSILPPVVIGETPTGALEVQSWLGFTPANHVLWLATSDWNGQSFGFTATGYSFFQIFANNFE